jgi:secreted Zn-dependent insulinase-like peptidase
MLSVFAEGLHPAMQAVLTTSFAQLSARRFFAADLAGLQYDLALTSRGLTLTLHGLSERLSLLGEALVKQLRDEAFWRREMQSEELFGNARDRLIRSLKSCELLQQQSIWHG